MKYAIWIALVAAAGLAVYFFVYRKTDETKTTEKKPVTLKGKTILSSADLVKKIQGLTMLEETTTPALNTGAGNVLNVTPTIIPINQIQFPLS